VKEDGIKPSPRLILMLLVAAFSGMVIYQTPTVGDAEIVIGSNL